MNLKEERTYLFICLKCWTGKKQSTVIHSIGKYFQTSGIIIVKAKDCSLLDEWVQEYICIERNAYLFGYRIAARECRFSIIQFQTCHYWELFLLLGIAKIMMTFGAKRIKNSDYVSNNGQSLCWHRYIVQNCILNSNTT